MISNQSTKKLRWATFIVGVLMLFGCARYFDFPALADTPPREIEPLLVGKEAPCYYYLLSVYIDQQSLWRVDASPKVVESIVRELELKNAKNVPPSFWKMPPYYWPRSLTANMTIYKSPDFGGEIREMDGDHYLLLHDKSANRAYIWHKYNF